MTVYVDDMYRYPIGEFGRMKMSHMIADTHDELVGMAILIGVAPKWIQHPRTPREHFDIAIAKRTIALKLGAVAITFAQCGCMEARKRHDGALGPPEEAEDWLKDWMAHRSKRRPENR